MPYLVIRVRKLTNQLSQIIPKFWHIDKQIGGGFEDIHEFGLKLSPKHDVLLDQPGQELTNISTASGRSFEHSVDQIFNQLFNVRWVEIIADCINSILKK
jgi:hypothetical protein